MNGCQFFDGAPCGVYVEKSNNVLLSGSTVMDHKAEKQRENMIRWKGEGKGNFINGCRIGKGTGESTMIDDQAGVALQGNQIES